MEGILKTGTILDRIMENKQREVEKLKRMGGLNAPARPRESGPSFKEALVDPHRKGRPIIAEIKKASPSQGVLRDPFHPEIIAAIYHNKGARCISVLTDEVFFQGSMRVLYNVREASPLPLLRKDFIIDRVQIEESALGGADAVLLIARALSDGLLQDLYQHAISHRLEPLVEVHTKEDLQRALELDPAPGLIGINNRDLTDFSVSIDRTLELLPGIPDGTVVVSESGLYDAGTLDTLLEAGVRAFLIGTALMKADDMGSALHRLVFE